VPPCHSHRLRGRTADHAQPHPDHKHRGQPAASTPCHSHQDRNEPRSNTTARRATSLDRGTRRSPAGPISRQMPTRSARIAARSGRCDTGRVSQTADCHCTGSDAELGAWVSYTSTGVCDS
jgi:hypothetical protein